MAEGLEVEPEANEYTKVRPRRLPAPVSALGHRDFSIYWFGQIISFTGTWMQGLALGWLIFRLTHSPLYLGLLGTITTIPVLALSLPAGVMADRFSKRKIMIVTQSLAMLQAFMLAGLTHYGLVQVWHILALAAFMGTVSASDMPARHAMVVELVGKKDLLNAISLNSAMFNLTRIAGPAVAGLIVATQGADVCFFVNAVSYLASIIGLLIIRPTPVGAGGSGEKIVAQIKEGLRCVRKDRLVLELLVMTGVASIFAVQYGTQIPAVALEVFKVGAKGQGILMSGAGLGALAAAVAVASFGHRFRRGSIVIFGSFLTPLGLIAFALSPVFQAAVVCLVVVGFGMMSFLAVSNSMIQNAAPDSMRGRVMSVRTFVFMGFAPFGALEIGLMAEYLGVRTSLMFGGLVFLAMALYFALRSRVLRHAP